MSAGLVAHGPRPHLYALLYGRKSMWESRLSHILRGTVGEIDGVQDVEIHELRLPSASDFAPQLALAKYAGPELSEWNLKWEPPSAQSQAPSFSAGASLASPFP